MAAQRLPIVGSDAGTWGTVLNGFLSVALVSGGTVSPGSLTLVSYETSGYTIGSQSSITTGGETVIADATGGNISITLPSASTYPYAIHTVKKIDSSSHTVTITATSPDTIDGGTTAVIKVQYASITIVSGLSSGGSAYVWYII